MNRASWFWSVSSRTEIGAPSSLIGAKLAIEPLLVRPDDVVGRGHNPGCGPVVDLEVDPAGIWIVALEVEDVANVCLAPRVDRLIGIADDEQVAMLAGQGRHHHILNPVRVLVLVDEDVPEL